MKEVQIIEVLEAIIADLNIESEYIRKGYGMNEEDADIIDSDVMRLRDIKKYLENN